MIFSNISFPSSTIPDAAFIARFLRSSSFLKRNLSFCANSSSSRFNTCAETRRLTSASRLFSVRRSCCSCSFFDSASEVDNGALTEGGKLPTLVREDGFATRSNGEKDCLGLIEDSSFVDNGLVGVPKELFDAV